MRKFIAISTFMFAATIPALASADVEISKVTEGAVHITYNAQDLTNQYGRERLERLIRSAAEKVCGPQDLRRASSLKQMQENRKCYNDAIAQALGSIPAIG